LLCVAVGAIAYLVMTGKPARRIVQYVGFVLLLIAGTRGTWALPSGIADVAFFGVLAAVVAWVVLGPGGVRDLRRRQTLE
jgi:hypothetical protein